MPEIKKYPAWEELTFANNFLFCKIMEENPEICRRLLEILLHIKIEKLSSPKSEWTMQETVGSKGVRFDVYTKDENRIFDIEIQTTNQKNLPKRARYYQSVIDMDNLSHGEKYSQLKESYVIFLCLFDPFSENLPVYFFENTCRTDNKIKLNDGAYKVFFNALDYAKMENDEEKNFLKFLSGHEAENGFTKSIEEKDIAFEEGVRQGLERGLEQGLEQGMFKAKIEGALVLIRNYNVPAETAAQQMGAPLDMVLAELERTDVK